MRVHASLSRRLTLIAAALALACFSSPAAAADKDNFVIVPGKSFGPIKKGATLAQLERMYGKANIRVRTEQPPHADFQKQRAAVIFPGTPNEAMAFLSERGNRVESVVVQKRGGKWRTKEGLHVGMGLAEMERVHGGPFAITGFGRDGGGAVNSSVKTAPARELFIRFTPASGRPPGAADEAVLNSEKGFRSDHAAARRAGLTVSVIWWDLAR